MSRGTDWSESGTYRRPPEYVRYTPRGLSGHIYSLSPDRVSSYDDYDDDSEWEDDADADDDDYHDDRYDKSKDAASREYDRNPRTDSRNYQVAHNTRNSNNQRMSTGSQRSFGPRFHQSFSPVRTLRRSSHDSNQRNRLRNVPCFDTRGYEAFRYVNPGAPMTNPCRPCDPEEPLPAPPLQFYEHSKPQSSIIREHRPTSRTRTSRSSRCSSAVDKDVERHTRAERDSSVDRQPGGSTPRTAVQSRDSFVPVQSIPYRNKQTPYVKLRMGEFRLFRILGGNGKRLRIELTHWPMSKAPDYQALSYAWGDAYDTVEILLNGLSARITRSLHDGLKMLQGRQRSSRQMFYWADALSINQQDPAEITAQVQNMREIYRRASSTAIWLGPSSADSHLAFELLDAVASSFRAGNNDGVRQLFDSPSMEPSITALVALFERGYWRRIWVVQEVLNSQNTTVHCGAAAIPWGAFHWTMEAFGVSSDYIEKKYVAGSHVSPGEYNYSYVLRRLGPWFIRRMENLQGSSPRQLQQALTWCRLMLASDPRDKVYGLLGLLPRDVVDRIVPDYGVSTRDVYTRTAEYIVSATQRLDVLGFATHFPYAENNLGLPTWVPDWSTAPGMTLINGLDNHFRAAGESSADVVLDKGHRAVLHIRAIVLDTTDLVGVTVSMTSLNEFMMAFVHWYTLLQSYLRGADMATRSRMEAAFCQLLVLGNVSSRFQTPDEWRRATFHMFAGCIAQFLPELPLHPELAAFAENDSALIPRHRSYGEAIQYYFRQTLPAHAFFVTKGGILGMATGAINHGDVVVVPFGCNTPLILHSEGTEGEYRLVSDAYVDGYMRGRAIDEYNRGECEAEWFTIH